MTLPNTYRKSRENIIASYDFTDLSSGTGIIKFNCFSVNGSYVLDEKEVYSNTIESTATSNAITFTKILDINFDLSSFNLPNTIRGTAFFNATQSLRHNTGVSKPSQFYLIYRIRKWDGSAETEIANAQSSSLTKSGTDPVNKLTCTKMIIPKTHFKKGEILRLTVEGWAKTSDADSNFRVVIGHDPKNRDGNYIIPSTDDPETITKLKAYIPFNINL